MTLQDCLFHRNADERSVGELRHYSNPATSMLIEWEFFLSAEHDAETDNPRASTCDPEQLLWRVRDAELTRSVYVLLHDVLNTLLAEKVSG